MNPGRFIWQFASDSLVGAAGFSVFFIVAYLVGLGVHWAENHGMAPGMVVAGVLVEWAMFFLDAAIFLLFLFAMGFRTVRELIFHIQDTYSLKRADHAAPGNEKFDA